MNSRGSTSKPKGRGEKEKGGEKRGEGAKMIYARAPETYAPPLARIQSLTVDI